MLTLTNGTTVLTPFDVLGWSSRRAARSVVHQPLARQDPDVTLRPAALRSGTLRLLFPTFAAAVACEQAHAAAVVWTLDDGDLLGQMRYVVAEGDLTVSSLTDSGGGWTVEVPYREVAP